MVVAARSGRAPNRESAEGTLTRDTMQLADTLEALRSLVGTRVEVSLWGREGNPAPFATLSGVLGEMEPPKLSRHLDSVTDQPASVFTVGTGSTNYISVWPDRFIVGAFVNGKSVEVVTRDGVIRVEGESRPWID